MMSTLVFITHLPETAPVAPLVRIDENTHYG